VSNHNSAYSERHKYGYMQMSLRVFYFIVAAFILSLRGR